MRELSFNLERAIAPQPIVLEPLTATENGTYLPEVGVNGYSSVEVAVPIPPVPVLTSLSVSENGTYTPEQGVDGFSSVEVEVDIPSNKILIEGDASNALRGASFWQTYKDRIEFGVLTNMAHMFEGNSRVYDEDLPTFTIDYLRQGSGIDLTRAFSSTSITEYPDIRNTDGGEEIDLAYSLGIADCMFIERLDPVRMSKITFISDTMNDFISGCYRLRNIPQCILEQMSSVSGDSSGGVSNCFSLDEIIGFPALSTSSSFLNQANHLKRFRYKFDGSSTVDADRKTIRFSNYIGYFPYRSTVFSSTNFTADTEITDAASYAALKNNPDAWTADIAYSRYNRASAAETITTLPTNIGARSAEIRFQGAAGSATDEGAINTMTNEEVAIATAKNWTVAYV